MFFIWNIKKPDIMLSLLAIGEELYQEQLKEQSIIPHKSTVHCS